MRFARTCAERFACFARSPTSALRLPTRTFRAFVGSTWTESATTSTTESARVQLASRYWRSGIRAAAQDRGCSRPQVTTRRAPEDLRHPEPVDLSQPRARLVHAWQSLECFAFRLLASSAVPSVPKHCDFEPLARVAQGRGCLPRWCWSGLQGTVGNRPDRRPRQWQLLESKFGQVDKAGWPGPGEKEA